MWEVIQDKDSYFLEELDKTLMKSLIHGNYLKKFWLQDSYFNIPENSNKNSSKNQDSDNEILEDEENDMWWISEEKDFAVLI